jgi:SAM-dependent methyltransferase
MYRRAMPEDLNPQAAHMADESMVRTLAAQADAIWPQEVEIVRRHALPPEPAVLDAGCGTGEATRRVADALPRSRVLGVDILDAHLERARAMSARFGDRVRYEHRSVFGLELPGASFDLTMCRHVIHSIPHPERVLAELVRVTRPGGIVHLIPEDYGMIHFPRRKLDPMRIWPEGPKRFGEATGTDLLVGRRAPALLAWLGLERITVDYVVVDTLRVPRATFVAIWEAWRDGYTEALAKTLGMTVQEAADHWNDQIATLRDEGSYAAWLVPVVAGVVPER